MEINSSVDFFFHTFVKKCLLNFVDGVIYTQISHAYGLDEYGRVEELKGMNSSLNL